MSETRQRWRVTLGDVDPAGSRQRGRRSAVAVTDEHVVVGTQQGGVRAFERSSGRERWYAPSRRGGSVVAATAFDGGVIVGERGPAGAVRAYDGTGDLRWRVETADDLGGPQQDSRFFYPFVADITTNGERWYVAARRYERDGQAPDGERRQFESVIYALEGNGEERWRYATDASPVALDASGGRVAVAFNRCPGSYQHGLAVLDAATGAERLLWDPGTEGQRRVGDVALVEDGAVCCSHGDYRGYRLDARGRAVWRIDLGRPVERGDDTVYTYPNHVHAGESGAVFVTGNTYPEDGRETAARHPTEHAAVGVSPDGRRRWTTAVGGFASALGTAGDTVAVPAAQHFRERDPATHGCRVFGVEDGPRETLDTEGVATAAAVADGVVAVVEEPVAYHDDGETRGAYRLHVERS